MNRAKLLTIICAAAMPVIIPSAMNLGPAKHESSTISQGVNSNKKSENITLLVSNDGNKNNNNEVTNNSNGHNVENTTNTNKENNNNAENTTNNSKQNNNNNNAESKANNNKENKTSTVKENSNENKTTEATSAVHKSQPNTSKNNNAEIKQSEVGQATNGSDVEVAYIGNGTQMNSSSGYAAQQIPQLQENLYNYLSSKENQEAVMKEATALHGGNASDTCVYFLSTALRNIGVNIPKSTAYTTILEGNLLARGWVRETNLNELQKGDIGFAGPYHTYVFMGWKDKAKGLAYIVDNQASSYGNSHYHDRNVHGQDPANPDQYQYATTCFYRYSGNQPTFPAKNTVILGNVTSSTLNVRSTNSTNGEILGTLGYNAEVQIVDQVNDWYKINYKGGTGYVYGINISPKKLVTNGNTNPDTTPNKPENNTPAPEATESGVVTANQLNVRAAATTNSAVIGSLNKGAKVGIIKKDGDWYQINYNGKIAYVSSDYIKVDAPVVKPENKPENNTPAPEATESGVITANQLNVRAAATTNSAIVGSLNKGAKVGIIKKDGDWYQINYNGKIAYVSAEYVKVDTPVVKPENKPEQNTGLKVKVNSPIGLNLRTSATTNSAVITVLPNNAVVNVIESSNGWYKVDYNGNIGWVSAQYATVVSGSNNGGQSNTPENTPEQNTELKVKINSPIGLNLRASATTNSAVITVLPNNAVVNVIESSNGWYKINYDGNTGWIYSQYATVVSGSNNGGQSNTPENTPEQNPQPEVPQSRVQVNSPIGLNLRTSATTNSAVITVLPNHAIVNVIESSNGWCKVNYNGNTGWIYSQYVLSAPENNSNNNNDNISKIKVNSPIGLNLRTSATTNSAVITVLPNNAVVNVIESSNGWYKVDYNGNTGWVSAQYATIISGSNNGGQSNTPENTPEQNPQPEVPQSRVQVNSPIGLNLRTSASTNSTVITVLPNNTIINVIESSNGWCKVNYNGNTGWIYSQYVLSAPENNNISKIKVNSPIGLNLRTGASTGNSIILALPDNAVATVIESSNGWYKVNYNGNIGWVDGNYVNAI